MVVEGSLGRVGTPCADDSIALPALDVNDPEGAAVGGQSDNCNTVLVAAIVQEHGKGIGEDGSGFLEGDTVVVDVGLGLRTVPLKVASNDCGHAENMARGPYGVKSIERERGHG